MRGVKWMKVDLSAPDSLWSAEFEQSKTLLSSIFGQNLLDIQHVGSTSIRGISAKPILDIGVVLKDLEKLDIAAMEHSGYRYMGPRNPAASRHLFFKYADSDQHDDIALEHVHCYGPDDSDFKILVGFRDYLNEHPDIAAEYDALKKDLAAKYPDDRFAYSDGKRSFIERIIDVLHRDLNV